VDLTKDGGMQYSAEYKQLNPQARVPALVSGRTVLTQSSAILEWLEETYPDPPLLPADAAGRARVRALSQLVVADIQPLQNISITNHLRDVLKLDAAGIRAWLQHWITRGMAALEAQLAGDPATGMFCHGDTPTLADVCLVPQAYSCRRFGVEVAQFPTVARIEAACNALSAFQAAAPEKQADATN
jgi:maleylacetoacetate isomerase